MKLVTHGMVQLVEIDQKIRSSLEHLNKTYSARRLAIAIGYTGKSSTCIKNLISGKTRTMSLHSYNKLVKVCDSEGVVL